MNIDPSDSILLKLQKITNKDDKDLDLRNGMYEILPAIIEAYTKINLQNVDARDLNLLYFLTTDRTENKKREYIQESHLLEEDKNNILSLTAKHSKNIGIFATGKGAIKKASSKDAQEFIKMCIVVYNFPHSKYKEEDDILEVVNKFIKQNKGNKEWKDIGIAVISQVLHVLAPELFPIINGSSKPFLKKLLKIRGSEESYIEDTKKIKKFRDQYLPYKHYRILDFRLWEIGEELENDTTKISPKEKTTFLSKAREVLEKNEKPMHYKEITEKALENGLQTDGKKPWDIMHMVLSNSEEIIKIEEGVFELSKRKDNRSKKTFAPISLAEVFEKIKKSGYVFSPEIITNFYLSLKTKPFVILAGISGTGKSLLPREFGKSIYGETDYQDYFTMIPVRPNWNDSTDLLGYFDPLSKKLKLHTLTRFIKKASHDIENPYFVCLDEMNLSHVEHYFSDILSILESRERKENGQLETDGFLIGEESDYEKTFPYGTVFYDTDEMKREIGIQLKIPQNIFFIGTVNMDETTHPFSKKVLDRANSIEFNEVYFDDQYFENSCPKENISFKNPQKKSSDSFWKKDAMTYHVKLVEIQNILKENDMHFGYRVRDEIGLYLENSQKLGFDLDTAFDFQISQKILPKIYGSDESLITMLKELEAICKTKGTKTKEDGYFFPHSAKKIKNMLNQLERDGFTTFWNQ